MLPGSKRGPKDRRWKKACRSAFEDFFARRSEPLHQAETDEAPLVEATGAGLKWLFSSLGDEPTQVQSAVGGRVRNVVLGVTGALVALGVGQEAGVGTCHHYWAVDDVEVDEGTAHATRRVRGGTGDLQMRLDDDRLVWCGSHHCRQWQVADGEPMARAATPCAAPALLLVAESPPLLSPPQPLLSPPPPSSLPLSCDVPEPTEQERVDAIRVERQTRHERMRALLRWLMMTRFNGKQIRLADALNVSGVWLNQYMKGTSGHTKPLSPQQLTDRHSALLRYLCREQLPTEIPTASEATAAAEAAAAATETATANRHPPKPSAATPVFAASPATAVLSFDLADAKVWQQGGQCHLMALGVPVLADARWVMPCPGGDPTRSLRLRMGLRGRRTLSARSHASVAGRTFEWWLEAIDARHEISEHGGPLWVAREVAGENALHRIVGRAPQSGGGYMGPSSPELLWQAIARHCGPDAPRFTGVVQTGLIHPGVQALLALVEEEGDGLPSLTGFGSRSGGVGELGRRHLRRVGAEAGVAFIQAMESVCPGAPEVAMAQLLRRRTVQALLPEHVRKALGKHALRDAALKLPFVAGLVKVFHALEGFRARRQHLSLFAPFFPYKVTMELFGVTRWQVCAYLLLSPRPHCCPLAHTRRLRRWMAHALLCVRPCAFGCALPHAAPMLTVHRCW